MRTAEDEWETRWERKMMNGNGRRVENSRGRMGNALGAQGDQWEAGCERKVMNGERVCFAGDRFHGFSNFGFLLARSVSHPCYSLDMCGRHLYCRLYQYSPERHAECQHLS